MGVRSHKKYEFPLWAELPIEPDMGLIEDFLWKEINHRWEDNITAHKGLAVASNNIANDTYAHVEHVHLTIPAPIEESLESPENYSTADKLKQNVSYTMNEHNWTEPQNFYVNTELQKHLNGLFKSKLIRTRFSRMKPGGEVPPHIDYNTTYAVRWILPIDGNEGVDNIFWDKDGNEHILNMKEGRIYFLNIGYRHAVYHRGKNIRHYLIGSLESQEDILHLLK